MAGIGFELKKLFRGKTILSRVRAYGYTGMITTGPMLLSIVFVLALSWVSRYFGLGRQERDVLVTLLTHCLLWSLFASGFFSMTVTRYIADMLYEMQKEEILSSIVGVLCFLLPGGGIPYGIFLLFSGIRPSLMLIAFILYMVLLVVWTLNNYMTAIRNYRGILVGYVLAMLSALVFAWLGALLLGVSVELLLVACAVGYSVMVLDNLFLLHQYFPDKGWNPFHFLSWFDRNRSLCLTGVLMNVGLYAHLLMIWHSEIGEQVVGAFYAAPSYDVPALFAFLTITITTINFTVSTEVQFYPVYRQYFDLFNGTGTVEEILVAEDQMLDVLDRELTYVARMQICCTLFMIALGPMILNLLPLGFTNLMNGYFRILCVGYGAYAVGNVLMMMTMYFADDAGAFRASLVFALSTTLGTAVTLFLPARYLGFGFAFGCIAYFIYCWHRLMFYTKHLGYYVLSTQPMVARRRDGVFTRLERRIKERLYGEHGKG